MIILPYFGGRSLHTFLGCPMVRVTVTLSYCRLYILICMTLQDMASLPGSQTPLRRHGDEFERLPNGYYRALGRCDDTMNLGGIKVSVLGLGLSLFCLSAYHGHICALVICASL